MYCGVGQMKECANVVGSEKFHMGMRTHSVVSCDHMDCSPPGFSVHGNSSGKNTGVVAISFSRGSSQPRD